MGNNKRSYVADSNIQVIDISWERLFLNVAVRSEYSDPIGFSLSRVTFSQKRPAEFIRDIALKPIDHSEGVYRFRINMAVIDEGGFLKNGRWFFVARVPGESRPHICTVSYDMAYELVDLDRVFPYGRGRYAYTTHFKPLCFDNVNIIPSLHSHFMIENMNWEKKFVVSERHTLEGKLRCARTIVKRAAVQSIYNGMSHFRNRDRRINVLLMSETKPFLWGNLKGLDDRIKERHLEDRINVTYSLRHSVGSHNSVGNWLSTLRKMSKQDFIFVDDYVPVFEYLDLQDDVKLVQVWHAGEGFKAIGYSRFGKSGSPHPVENCHRHYDYVITGSEHLSGVYSELFGVPEEKVLPLGMARLDNLLEEDKIKEKTEKFYRNHPECKGKKLILFAPTFRGRSQKSSFFDYSTLDQEMVYDFCGDEYIWAFKMHPFIEEKPPIEERFRDRIIDLSDVTDIHDLYPVTDIMVTDYSSAYYEFSMFKRPVLFYTYDRPIYEVVRGVHQSILETAPGKVCDTMEELITALKTGDYELEKTIAFSDECFSDVDDNAADRIIDQIILGGTADSGDNGDNGDTEDK